MENSNCGSREKHLKKKNKSCMFFCETLFEYVDHRLQPSQNLNTWYRKSCKIREKNAVSGVFLANLKIITTSSDMTRINPFPTSRLAYPWCFHCLPRVKFCFWKSTETWSTKSGEPSVYPKSAPVCSSASWHQSEHSMSHPPTVVAGHLFGGWVFCGGCFYGRGKEGWLNLLK